jgi:hypothetical protein
VGLVADAVGLVADAVGLVADAVGLVGDAEGLLLTAGAVAAANEVGVADVVAFDVALAVLACVVVGFALALEVLVGAGVELVDGLAVVVLGLADVDAFEDADEPVVAVAVRAEGEGSVLAVGVAVAEALAVGSLVDGCGLGEPLGDPVGVGVGVGVGEEVDCGNGWHCCTAPVDAATAAVSSTGCAAGAASANPEAAAARTPPVTTPTTTGCTCAIRIKGPARAVCGMPCSCRTPLLDTNDSAQC